MANQELNCYLGINGQQYGPMSESDVQKMYDNGEIAGDTKFIQAGMTEWVKLSEAGIFTPPFPPLPPLPEEPQTQSPPSSPQKTVVTQAQATPGATGPQEPVKEEVGNTATSDNTGNKIDNMVKKVSGIKLNDAVSKVSKLAENVQHEVNSSETISNIKAGAGNKFEAMVKRVDEFAESVSQSQDGKTSETTADTESEPPSEKSKIHIIIGAIIVVIAIVLILFVPFFRWVFLIGALGWLGYAFYNKANKVLPIIISVIVLALVIFIPADGTGSFANDDLIHLMGATQQQVKNTLGQPFIDTDSALAYGDKGMGFSEVLFALYDGRVRSIQVSSVGWTIAGVTITDSLDAIDGAMLSLPGGYLIDVSREGDRTLIAYNVSHNNRQYSLMRVIFPDGSGSIVFNPRN